MVFFRMTHSADDRGNKLREGWVFEDWLLDDLVLVELVLEYHVGVEQI